MMEKLRALFSVKSGRQRIVTRFPPSPTGNLHIGGVRTALFNYLFAKQNGGSFLLRIEDTDRARSKKEYENNILEGLSWLGLRPDNDTLVRQSERGGIYSRYLEQLISEGKAYISKEVPKEPGDRDEVIRFKNPNKNISFEDMVRGNVSVDTTDLGDFVIAKSLDEPIYHLAVVVDDYEMGVTHVIRGEDHVSNTPRQILIQEALGFPRPTYAHIPLILASDRSKLSKRHGAISLTEYRDRGYEPDALINYLALLGWNPGTEQEIFSRDELVRFFDLTKVQKGGAIFSEEKLRWVNKEHLKRLPQKIIASIVGKIIRDHPRIHEHHWEISDEMIERSASMFLERMETYDDLRKALGEGEYDFLFVTPRYDAESLRWKNERDENQIPRHLDKVIELLEKIPESKWKESEIKATIWQYAESAGRGNVLWPYRYALSGRDTSPNPFGLSYIFGKEETLRRLKIGTKLAQEYARKHSI